MSIFSIGDDLYSQQIKNFLIQEFPQATGTSPADVLDAVTEAFLTSGNVRLGPRPNPESIVKMREVFADCIQRRVPIPVLVPAGPKKPDGSSLDVAELSAMRQLKCLQARVQAHYEPGIIVRIRLEDLMGVWLEGCDTLNTITAYCNDFRTMVRLLDYHTFLHPMTESNFMSWGDFYRSASNLTDIFSEYLSATENNPDEDPSHLLSFRKLVEHGWAGAVGSKARAYYYSRFSKLFPGAEKADQLTQLSMYYAGSLARKNLGATGANPRWNGKYIALSFATIPVDPQQASTRLYYRTIPAKYSSNNMPYWRAKGYLRIRDDSVRINLTTWDDPVVNDLSTNHTVLTDGVQSVTIRTDYSVE